LLFQHFQVEEHDRPRILAWGFAGAIVLRAVLIVAGLELLRHIHPVIFVFAGVLILTGLKTLLSHGGDDEARIEKRRDVRALRRWLPLAKEPHPGHFFAREGGKRVVTLLFLVLVIIELTDVIFAFDSIPAVLAITTDPFNVYVSNLLAILGLRSLYFVLEHSLQRLEYLKPGLGVLLVVIGIKMIVAEWVHIPAWVSLGIVVTVLGITTLLSLLRRRSGHAAEPGT
jgi:tellurite resistance protein TerC